MTTLRVLIWGKTYPELSSHHTETVCTGGVLEDGAPVRLYPVPLRYLDGDQEFRLYDLIDVPAERSRKDPRPESYRIASGEVRILKHVDTEKGTWRTRRDLIFRNPGWHYASVGALKRAQQLDGRSMGLVTPGQIDEVRLVQKSAADRHAFDQKLAAIQSQSDIFRAEYKELEFLEYDVRLHWRCIDRCAECVRGPHKMKVLDWGLLELGRRDGWEKARAKLEDIANLETHEFRLFLGNFFLHQQTFGIIGLWWPKRRAQLDLF